MLAVILKFSFIALAMGRGTPGMDPSACLTPAQRAAMERAAMLTSAMESSPFRYVCNDPKYFRNMPESRWYDFGYQTQDAGSNEAARKTREMLIEMHEFLIRSLENDINISNNYLVCMDAEPGSPNKPVCDEIGATYMVDREIAHQSVQARFHLAMGVPPHSQTIDIFLVNNLMNVSPVTYKHEPWTPLTERELDASVGLLDRYKAEVREAVANRPGEHGPNDYYEVKARLLEKREEHYRTYATIMHRFPVLQFVKNEIKPKPPWDPAKRAQWTAQQKLDWQAYESSRVELKQAFQKAITHRKKQIADLRAMLAKLKDNGQTCQENWRFGTRTCTPNYNSSVLAEAVNVLEDWSPHVQEYLMYKPDDCGLATALSMRKGKRNLAMAAAIVVPLLGVSLIAPPAAAALYGPGAGIATSLAIGAATLPLAVDQYNQSVENLDKARQRAAGGSVAGQGRGTTDETWQMTFDDFKAMQNQSYLQDVLQKHEDKNVAITMVGASVVLPLVGARPPQAVVNGIKNLAQRQGIAVYNSNRAGVPAMLARPPSQVFLGTP